MRKKNLFLSLFSISIALLFTLACQTLHGEQVKRKDCNTSDILLSGKDFQAHVTRYSETQLSDKAVILMPPTGGVNFIDRSYAKKLCRAGFDVYIVASWTGEGQYTTELDIHSILYARAQEVIRRTLEKIPSAGFVGILGTSVGATFTVMAMNLHPRLDAAFTIAGGAPIPSVIVYSDQKAMVDLKKKRFEKFGFKNDEEYLSALDKVFPQDPFKTAPLFKGKALGMSISSIDTTVPARFQQAQVELWKPQTLYARESSHFSTIVKTWWNNEEDIVQFFINAANK